MSVNFEAAFKFYLMVQYGIYYAVRYLLARWESLFGKQARALTFNILNTTVDVQS